MNERHRGPKGPPEPQDRGAAFDDDPTPPPRRKLELPKPGASQSVAPPKPLSSVPSTVPKSVAPPGAKAPAAKANAGDRLAQRLIGLTVLVVCGIVAVFVLRKPAEPTVELNTTVDGAPAVTAEVPRSALREFWTRDAPKDVVTDTTIVSESVAGLAAPTVTAETPSAPTNRRTPQPMWSKERIQSLGEQMPPFPFEVKTDQDPHYDTPPGPKQPMITVYSYPPGMTVELDGQVAGRTPFIRPVVRPVDRVRIKLRAPGFESQEHVLTPNADGHFQLGAKMVLQPG